jgi:Tol biopolymer transport system component
MVDDAQLAELFRSYVDTGVRPFDPRAVAAHAIADGRRPTRGLSVRAWPARRISPLMAVGLLLLGAAVAVVGAALLLKQRPVAGLIAISAPGVGGEQVLILDPDGTGETLLPPTGHLAYPVWSPNGSRLAYSDEHNNGPVRVVNADGTGHRPISDGYDSGFPVAWSPDGRQVVFLGHRHRASADLGLFVVDADGTGVVRLSGPNAPLFRLAWAPDGSLISGVAGVMTPVREGPRGGFVQVVDPRTGEATSVSRLPLVPTGDQPYFDWAPPSWSPDSSRLLYSVAGGEGSWDIAVAERTASGWIERLVVANPSTSDISPLWLGSDRFVFVRDMSRLIVANADGSGERELLRDSFFPSTAPCVAPDGSRVAVVVGNMNPTFRGELLIVAVDGTSAPVRIPIDYPGNDGQACSWQGLAR